MSGTTSAAPRAAAPRGPGLHRPVRAGVPQHGPAVRRAAAGDPGAQDQRPGRHRARAGEPVAGHGGRCARGDGRQPDLRRAERPDHVPVRQATTVDDRRSGRRYGRILVVALAPNVAVVLLGWCVAQVFFNALLAAQVAVLPDQVPVAQRGTVAGVLGVCLPLASVGGTYVVNVFSGNELAMFLVPCAIAGALRRASSRWPWTTVGWPRGAAAWSLRAPGRRSTSTRAGIPTSCGPSSAGSCSSSPTPSW